MLVRPRCLPLLLLVVLTTGCGTAREAAVRGSDCVGLARDVAASGLDRTPTREQAEDAVRRLDERVEQLDDRALREAADDLRDRLRELQAAARSSDGTAVRRATDAARESARAAAQVCGVPVEQFLG